MKRARTAAQKAATKKWQAAGAAKKSGKKKMSVSEQRKRARAALAKSASKKAAGQHSLKKVKGLDRQGRKYSKSDLAFIKKTSRQSQIKRYDAAKKAARKNRKLKSVKIGF